MNAFLLALQLLTRLPVKLDESVYDDKTLAGRSLLFYPLVGLIIGLLLVVTSKLLLVAGLSANSLVLAALILTVWVGITGALHLDGLGDSADAWLGGYGDPERSLEIMKDPYCGPAAVVSIVLLLIIKFAALSQLAANGWLWLILSPVLARSAIIVLFISTPYVRKAGMGEALAQNLPQSTAITVLGIVGLLSLVLLGFWNGLLLLVIVALVIAGLRYLMLKRIHGTTGDTAGAMIEIIEAAVLIVACMFV